MCFAATHVYVVHCSKQRRWAAGASHCTMHAGSNRQRDERVDAKCAQRTAAPPYLGAPPSLLRTSFSGRCAAAMAGLKSAYLFTYNTVLCAAWWVVGCEPARLRDSKQAKTCCSQLNCLAGTGNNAGPTFWC